MAVVVGHYHSSNEKGGCYLQIMILDKLRSKVAPSH